MKSLAEVAEQKPSLAQDVFNAIDGALNQVLPGSNVHARYVDAEEIGLALLVGRTDQPTYNPFDVNTPKPSFFADNQASRSGAWQPIPKDSEFLEGRETDLGRFAFFALAKTENLRIAGGYSSYDPNRLAISPGRVGFAGGRRLMVAFVTPSGLWEVHDHLVSGAYATEVLVVAEGISEPKTPDDFAEYFEREFARIKGLHSGVEASELSHADIRQLLPLVDMLPC